MKKVLVFAVVALFAMSANKALAQSFKFGHINNQELIQAMPELDSAQKKLETYRKELQEVLKDIQTEYQTKMKDMEDKLSTWSEPVKNAKQKELNDILRRLQEQDTSAQQDYNQQQQKLFAPVINMAQQAVAKVSKDNGFTFVIDTSTGAVLYFNEVQSTDIMPLVKKELKITK